MRQDVILALAISAFIHGGLFLEGKFIPRRPPAHRTFVSLVPQKPFELPREEPPPPETTDTREEPTKVETYVPDIRDTPQSVNPQIDFEQRLQPPPPEGVVVDSRIGVIPNDRSSLPSSAKVFEPATLDQAPVARFQPPPEYPSEQKRLGITGDVVVDFIVDAHGNVQNAHAISSNYREFEEAAVKAVARWRFKPGRKGLATVNTHMQVPIVFNLNSK
jgi:protein TonB